MTKASSECTWLWSLTSVVSCQLNQHLKDGLCQQLLKLDEVFILGPDASPGRGEETGDGDMEQQVGAESKMSFDVIRNWWFKAGFFAFLPSCVRMRSSVFHQSSSRLDCWLSFWGLSLFCLTTPLSLHPETFGKLQSFCAVKYVWYNVFAYEILRILRKGWITFTLVFVEYSSPGCVCSVEEFCAQKTNHSDSALDG